MFLCPAGQTVAIAWILGKSDHGVFRRPSVRPKHEKRIRLSRDYGQS